MLGAESDPSASGYVPITLHNLRLGCQLELLRAIRAMKETTPKMPILNPRALAALIATLKVLIKQPPGTDPGWTGEREPHGGRLHS